MADPVSFIAARVGQWVAVTVFQAVTSIGVSVATAATIANVAYFATMALVYVGSYAAMGALARPSARSPESLKTPFNQSQPPQQIGYGMSRVSGPRGLYHNVPGAAVDVIFVNQGRIGGYDKFYLHEDEVTTNGAGVVNALSDGSYGEGAVQILHRQGLPTETAYAEITAIAGSLWDSDHRADGVATLGLIQRAVKDKNVLKVYRNGSVSLSALARLSVVFDWRDPSQSRLDPATWKWSANPIVCFVHNEWCIYGEDWALRFAPVLEILTDEADYCDALVPTWNGGTEPRYRIGLVFDRPNHRADVRRRFQDACDGFLHERGDGALILRAARYEEPDFVLTDKHVIRIDWRRGTPGAQKTNEIAFTYIEPSLKWTQQPGRSYRVQADVDQDGEVKSQPLDLTVAYSHDQGRRLAYRAYRKARATHRGTVVCDLAGLNWDGKPFIRLRNSVGPSSQRDVTLLIVDAKFNWSALEVTFDVIKLGAEVDEIPPGLLVAPPTADEVPLAPGLPVPTLVSVATFANAGTTQLRIRMANLSRPELSFIASWREDSSAEWIEDAPRAATLDGSQLVLETGIVTPSPTLEVYVQSSLAGDRSVPSATAIADASSRPWDPTMASTPLARWFDLQDGATLAVADGAASAVASKVGADVLVQATAGNRPAYGATLFDGARPGLSFDGTDDGLNTTSVSDLTGPLTVISVFTMDGAATAYARLVSLGPASLPDYVNGFVPILRDNSSAAIDSYRNNALVVTAAIATGVPAIVVNDADATTIRFVVNGTAGSAVSSTHVAYAPGELAVGMATNGAGYRWKGKLGELLIYKGSLSLGDRQKAEGYLAWRWGLTAYLPSGHPYKSFAP